MMAPQRNRNSNLLVSSHETEPLNQEGNHGFIWLYMEFCTCCMHTLVLASKITLLTFVFVIFSRLYIYIYIYTGAGHIIRISSKS